MFSFLITGSSIKKKPKTPIKITITPITVKIKVQLLLLSRSRAIKPPKTASIATSGIIEFMPSALPRFDESVLSVSQALKAASFALEPKNVITQSKIMTSETPILATDTAVGKSAFNTSNLTSEKQSIETPQSK